MNVLKTNSEEITYFDMTEYNKEWDRLYGDQPVIIHTPGIVIFDDQTKNVQQTSQKNQSK